MLYSIESTSGKTNDYKYVSILRTFDSAKNICEADGWHLAMFHSKTDLDDVYREFCDDDINYVQWLGGEWKNSAWHWVMDDSVMDLQNFPGLDFPKGDQDVKLSIKGEGCPQYKLLKKNPTVIRKFVCMKESPSGATGSATTAGTMFDYSESQLSTSFITSPSASQRIDEINDHILHVRGLNITLNESIEVTTGILRHMQEIVDDFIPPVGSNQEPKVEKDITEMILSLFDELAMFILNKTTSDNGAIEFKTRSFVFILEKNSLENLGNTTLMVGPHSGFEIPPLLNHLPRSHQNVTNSVNRMVLRIGSFAHEISNVTHKFTTDILTLSFTT
ncbi:uncharacterized protein [Ptychodera flava]|uniref:uncharacterized protein n=1 Tax=Ptychodera flava TaxID=63121 RepID=UPI00396A382B